MIESIAFSPLFLGHHFDGHIFLVIERERPEILLWVPNNPSSIIIYDEAQDDDYMWNNIRSKRCS